VQASIVTRRLAAILCADVVGYSRLVAEDEEGTLRTLSDYRATIADLVGEHAGRIFGTAGDSLIVEFASPVQAVRAAVAIQRALHRRNMDLPVQRRLQFRIGINIGDVVADGDDLLGGGVNVAARLQEIAEPGRHLRDRGGAGANRRQARFPPHAAWRARAQEYSPTRRRVPCRLGCRGDRQRSRAR